MQHEKQLKFPWAEDLCPAQGKRTAASLSQLFCPGPDAGERFGLPREPLSRREGREAEFRLGGILAKFAEFRRNLTKLTDICQIFEILHLFHAPLEKSSLPGRALY